MGGGGWPVGLYLVSASPSPFFLDFGLWILDFVWTLDFKLKTWIWDSGLGLGLDNYLQSRKFIV